MLRTIYYNISVYRQKHREVVVRESSPWELQGKPGIEIGALDFAVTWLFPPPFHVVPSWILLPFPSYKDPMSVYMFRRVKEGGKPKIQTQTADGECLALVREILWTRKSSWSWPVPQRRLPPPVPTHRADCIQKRFWEQLSSSGIRQSLGSSHGLPVGI